MVENTTLGEMIAYHRRRHGLSQVRFAELLNRSESWVSQVERGARRIDRLSVLQEIARVLDVPASALLPDSFSLATPEEHPAVQAVRLALTGQGALTTLFPREPTAPPPATELQAFQAQAAKAWDFTHASKYAEASDLLMRLIPDLEVAARRYGGPDQEAAYLCLTEVYQAASALMSKLAETDVAWIAADRSITAAERSNHPLSVAAGHFRLAHAFLAGSQHDQAARAATVALEALKPYAQETRSPEFLSIWGALNLVRAIVASRQNDASAAYECLEKAKAAADRLGEDRNDFDTEFGPTNVALHEVAVAVELGDAGSALRTAERIDPSGLSAERRARFLIDMARAYQQLRRGDDVLQTLEEAERLTPEQVRSHRYVQEMVRDLVRDESRRLSLELRGLAQRTGVLL